MNNSAGNSTARIFFALWPDKAECRALAAWQNVLQPVCGGRAMRRETLHATLVFIGEITLARLEALKLTAEEVSAESFELCFDQARYWGHNHILYAAPGVVAPQLVHLVSELERHLNEHRFKYDVHSSREYKPHVTLRRNAHWRDDPLPEMSPVRWQVRDFVLLQSEQQNGYVSYRVLVRFPLS